MASLDNHRFFHALGGRWKTGEETGDVVFIGYPYLVDGARVLKLPQGFEQ